MKNVASMDVEVRDQISDLLGVTPYKVDPSRQVLNSRPRFCWTNQSMEELEGLRLWDYGGYTEIEVDGEWPDPRQWITPDWVQDDPTAVYPTFMKAITAACGPVANRLEDTSSVAVGELPVSALPIQSKVPCEPSLHQACQAPEC